MKSSALLASTLVLNGLWKQFSPEEQKQLSQDSNTWSPELVAKVNALVSELDSKK